MIGRGREVAQLAGIPVLAVNRGGIPEMTIGGASLFDIPEACTGRYAKVPSAEQVRPWLEQIETRAGELHSEHVEETARFVLQLRHQREEEIREAARREMRAVAEAVVDSGEATAKSGADQQALGLVVPSEQPLEEESGAMTLDAAQAQRTASEGDGVHTLVVLGSFSSGTTALVGYLARLGAYTCPPHMRTNDPRTPDPHEPRALRDQLVSYIHEPTLKPQVEDLSGFRAWFEPWLAEQKAQAAASGYTHVVLKHPLAAFFIEDLAEVGQPTFLVMSRRFEAIEQSRQRRGWGAVYGKAGALCANLVSDSAKGRSSITLRH